MILIHNFIKFSLFFISWSSFIKTAHSLVKLVFFYNFLSHCVLFIKASTLYVLYMRV